MTFLLSFLLLVCACFSQSVSSGTIIVSQSPDVSFQEGETGNITCCLNGMIQRFRTTWLKNQTSIKNQTVINHSTGSQNEQRNTCSVLTIDTVKINDSGRYICKVSLEIPVLTEVEGNGTTITVRAREKIPVITDDPSLNEISIVTQEDFITFVLRCLPILALIAAFFWLFHLGTKAWRDTRAAFKNEATSPQSREEDQEADEGLREHQQENDEETMGI